MSSVAPEAFSGPLLHLLRQIDFFFVRQNQIQYARRSGSDLRFGRDVC